MANCVDAAMQAMQATAAQPRIDCVFSKAEIAQLRPRNDPMAPLGKPGDVEVRRPRSRFPAYVTGNRDLALGRV
jgi:hypothetical protein